MKIHGDLKLSTATYIHPEEIFNSKIAHDQVLCMNKMTIDFVCVFGFNFHIELSRYYF